MARTLKQFREQHQEFNALSDQELADGLHHKYFSDIPKERFYKQIDFAPEQPLDEYTPLSPMLAEATAGVFSRPNAPQEDASPPMSDYLGMESPAPEQVSPGPMDEHERRRLAAKQQPTVSVKPPSEWEDPTLPEPRSILDQAREEGDVKQYTSALNAATAPGEQPALPSDMMDAESPAPNVVTPGEMSEHERRRLADPTRSGIGNWKDTTVNDPTGNFFPESRENESILDQAKREGDAKWYNDTLSDVGTTAKRILLSPKEGVEAMAVFEQERARQSQQLMEEALGPNAPQEMRDRIRTEAESEVAQAKKLEDYLSSIKTPDKVYNEGVASWIEDSLYGIGQSAIPMMATMVSPAIGYLMQHAMIAGDKLKEYKAQGINPRVAWESANLAASLQAPFETALDVVELGQLKKMFLGEGASSFVAKFMKGILTNAASEGFEELSQAHMEVIADIFAQNPQITPQELTRKVLDTWKSSDFQKNAWTAAGLGATGGALMFGIGGAVGSLTHKVLAPKRALTMRVVVSNGTDTANVEYNSRTKKVTDAPEGMEDLIGKPIEDAMSALKSNNFNAVREEVNTDRLQTLSNQQDEAAELSPRDVNKYLGKTYDEFRSNDEEARNAFRDELKKKAPHKWVKQRDLRQPAVLLHQDRKATSLKENQIPAWKFSQDQRGNREATLPKSVADSFQKYEEQAAKDGKSIVKYGFMVKGQFIPMSDLAVLLNWDVEGATKRADDLAAEMALRTPENHATLTFSPDMERRTNLLGPRDRYQFQDALATYAFAGRPQLTEKFQNRTPEERESAKEKAKDTLAYYLAVSEDDALMAERQQARVEAHGDNTIPLRLYNGNPKKFKRNVLDNLIDFNKDAHKDFPAGKTTLPADLLYSVLHDKRYSYMIDDLAKQLGSPQGIKRFSDNPQVGSFSNDTAEGRQLNALQAGYAQKPGGVMQHTFNQNQPYGTPRYFAERPEAIRQELTKMWNNLPEKTRKQGKATAERINKRQAELKTKPLDIRKLYSHETLAVVAHQMQKPIDKLTVADVELVKYKLTPNEVRNLKTLVNTQMGHDPYKDRSRFREQLIDPEKPAHNKLMSQMMEHIRGLVKDAVNLHMNNKASIPARIFTHDEARQVAFEAAYEYLLGEEPASIRRFLEKKDNYHLYNRLRIQAEEAIKSEAIRQWQSRGGGDPSSYRVRSGQSPIMTEVLHWLGEASDFGSKSGERQVSDAKYGSSQKRALPSSGTIENSGSYRTNQDGVKYLTDPKQSIADPGTQREIRHYQWLRGELAQAQSKETITDLLTKSAAPHILKGLADSMAKDSLFTYRRKAVVAAKEYEQSLGHFAPDKANTSPIQVERNQIDASLESYDDFKKRVTSKMRGGRKQVPSKSLDKIVLELYNDFKQEGETAEADYIVNSDGSEQLNPALVKRFGPVETHKDPRVIAAERAYEQKIMEEKNQRLTEYVLKMSRGAATELMDQIYGDFDPNNSDHVTFLDALQTSLVSARSEQLYSKKGKDASGFDSELFNRLYENWRRYKRVPDWQTAIQLFKQSPYYLAENERPAGQGGSYRGTGKGYRLETKATPIAEQINARDMYKTLKDELDRFGAYDILQPNSDAQYRYLTMEATLANTVTKNQPDMHPTYPQALTGLMSKGLAAMQTYPISSFAMAQSMGAKMKNHEMVNQFMPAHFNLGRTIAYIRDVLTNPDVTALKAHDQAFLLGVVAQMERMKSRFNVALKTYRDTKQTVVQYKGKPGEDRLLAKNYQEQIDNITDDDERVAIDALRMMAKDTGPDENYHEAGGGQIMYNGKAPIDGPYATYEEASARLKQLDPSSAENPAVSSAFITPNKDGQFVIVPRQYKRSDRRILERHGIYADKTWTANLNQLEANMNDKNWEWNWLLNILDQSGIEWRVAVSDSQMHPYVLQPNARGSATINQEKTYTLATLSGQKAELTSYQEMEDTFIHETLHTLINHQVGQNAKLKEDLHKEVLRVWDKISESDMDRLIKASETNPLLRYVLKSVVKAKTDPKELLRSEEIVAVAFSNAEVAQLFDTIMVETPEGNPESLWETIKRIILKIVDSVAPLENPIGPSFMDALAGVMDRYIGVDFTQRTSIRPSSMFLQRNVEKAMDIVSPLSYMLEMSARSAEKSDSVKKIQSMYETRTPTKKSWLLRTLVGYVDRLAPLRMISDVLYQHAVLFPGVSDAMASKLFALRDMLKDVRGYQSVWDDFLTANRVVSRVVYSGVRSPVDGSQDLATDKSIAEDAIRNLTQQFADEKGIDYFKAQEILTSTLNRWNDFFFTEIIVEGWRAGVITEKVFKAISDMHAKGATYATFDFLHHIGNAAPEIGKHKGNAQAFSVSKSDVVKAMEGSDIGKIDRPTDATIRKFVKAMNLYERNKVVRALVEDPDINPVAMLERVAQSMDEYLEARDDAIAQGKPIHVRFTREGDKRPGFHDFADRLMKHQEEKGEPINIGVARKEYQNLDVDKITEDTISWINKGKTETYVVDKVIADAMRSMNFRVMLGPWWTAFNDVFRKSATVWNPKFLFKNMMRDMFLSYVASPVHVNPLTFAADYLRGLKSGLKSEFGLAAEDYYGTLSDAERTFSTFDPQFLAERHLGSLGHMGWTRSEIYTDSIFPRNLSEEESRKVYSKFVLERGTRTAEKITESTGLKFGNLKKWNAAIEMAPRLALRYRIEKELGSQIQTDTIQKHIQNGNVKVIHVPNDQYQDYMDNYKKNVFNNPTITDRVIVVDAEVAGLDLKQSPTDNALLQLTYRMDKQINEEINRKVSFIVRQAGVDFNRGGTTTKSFNAYFPFLNARVQGSATLYRALLGGVKDPNGKIGWANLVNPKYYKGDNTNYRARNAFKLFLTAAIPSLVSAALFGMLDPDGEARKEANKWIKQNNWLFFAGWTTDEKGHKVPRLVKIPMGEVGIFARPFLNWLVYEDNPEESHLKQFLLDTASVIVNTTVPINISSFEGPAGGLHPLMKGLLQIATGRDFFRNRDLETGKMKDELVFNRKRPDTPAVFVIMSKLLYDAQKAVGITNPTDVFSPVRLQSLADSVLPFWGGRGEQVVTKPTQVLKETAGVFYEARGGGAMNRFWDSYGKLVQDRLELEDRVKEYLANGDKKAAVREINKYNKSVDQALSKIDINKLREYGYDVDTVGPIAKQFKIGRNERTKLFRGEPLDERSAIEKKLQTRRSSSRGRRRRSRR